MVVWIDAQPKPRFTPKNRQHVASLRPVWLPRHLSMRVSQAQESGRSLTDSNLVNGMPTSIFASSHRDLLKAVLHG